MFFTSSRRWTPVVIHLYQSYIHSTMLSLLCLWIPEVDATIQYTKVGATKHKRTRLKQGYPSIVMELLSFQSHSLL
jgi:hypothetical protein